VGLLIRHIPHHSAVHVASVVRGTAVSSARQTSRHYITEARKPGSDRAISRRHLRRSK